MTIGELRALPVGRGHIGQVRYLPLGQPGKGRGRGAQPVPSLGRDVPANIIKIGVKLPFVGEATSQEDKVAVESTIKQELESLKPDLSDNPWIRSDLKKTKVKLSSFSRPVRKEEQFKCIESTECGIVEERNSSRREDLKRELDEVLRGIREMGGVTAIFREGEREREKERERNLWRVDGGRGRKVEVEPVSQETDAYQQEMEGPEEESGDEEFAELMARSSDEEEEEKPGSDPVFTRDEHEAAATP